MPVRIEIPPCGRTRFDVVREADGGGHILEAATILAIEAIGAAAETDELVEIAVVVEVGPRVGLATVGGEEIRLDERKPR